MTFFQKEDLIFSYSRKQAIEDGFQICVSELFPDDTRVYKFPVYFTKAVWELCQENAGIVWDICYMGSLPGNKQLNEQTIQYSVIVQGADRKPDFHEDSLPCYRLISVCGAIDIDNPEPARTVMFPDER